MKSCNLRLNQFDLIELDKKEMNAINGGWIFWASFAFGLLYYLLNK